MNPIIYKPRCISNHGLLSRHCAEPRRKWTVSRRSAIQANSNPSPPPPPSLPARLTLNQADLIFRQRTGLAQIDLEDELVGYTVLVDQAAVQARRRQKKPQDEALLPIGTVDFVLGGRTRLDEDAPPSSPRNNSNRGGVTVPQRLLSVRGDATPNPLLLPSSFNASLAPSSVTHQIPLVPEIVASIEPYTRRIVIVPPDGLLDMGNRKLLLAQLKVALEAYMNSSQLYREVYGDDEEESGASSGEDGELELGGGVGEEEEEEEEEIGGEEEEEEGDDEEEEGEEEEEEEEEDERQARADRETLEESQQQDDDEEDQDSPLSIFPPTRRMPSLSILAQDDRTDLIRAIRAAGGFVSVALALGYRASRRPAGYYESEDMLAEEIALFVSSEWIELMNPDTKKKYYYNPVINQTRDKRPRVPQRIEMGEGGVVFLEDERERFMPTSTAVTAAGRWDLHRAILSYGGYKAVAELLERSPSFPRNANLGSSRAALLRAVREVQRATACEKKYMPRQVDFWEQGRTDVLREAQKAGGLRVLAERVGLEVRLPRGRWDEVEEAAEALWRYMMEGEEGAQSPIQHYLQEETRIKTMYYHEIGWKEEESGGEEESEKEDEREEEEEVSSTPASSPPVSSLPPRPTPSSSPAARSSRTLSRDDLMEALQFLSITRAPPKPSPPFRAVDSLLAPPPPTTTKPSISKDGEKPPRSPRPAPPPIPRDYWLAHVRPPPPSLSSPAPASIPRRLPSHKQLAAQGRQDLRWALRRHGQERLSRLLGVEPTGRGRPVGWRRTSEKKDD